MVGRGAGRVLGCGAQVSVQHSLLPFRHHPGSGPAQVVEMSGVLAGLREPPL